ncbi:L-asparagine transporter-like permease [Salirhabdus euzebyi]|uniref:L-asparagine transporter-like permease n=1 Tax=Salirhabdus euzebyi TaxID=394506 RepID=A0A841Q837_9BACI|nr:amino acid permease [Salirhabdus euzebyi]MBB6454493.1 L-asparagine transporter-like permease [Salirhabdus euzebyi]
MSQSKTNTNNKGSMKWWQLSLFGVGCTIGTGFFLGSSFGIKLGGPSILIGFVLAGLTTYLVFDALARMTANDPQKGAFRTYAKKALGHWAGFSVGWVYWSSEMLIMGSQLTALSIFTRFWFPNIPMWIFATGYGVLGLVVLLAGAKKLSKLENIFAVIKIAAIVMFIAIAAAFVFGWIDTSKNLAVPNSIGEWFPKGFLGFWSSLIFAFYAFGGIEVMGLMATELKNPKDAPKAGSIMLIVLVIIYVLSIGLALLLIPWDGFNTDDSPFVTVLEEYNLSIMPHVFNGALIIAGFSTMVAALYGVTTILGSLAEDGDAPKVFAKKGKLKIPFASLVLLIIVLIGSIIMALVLPEKIYEYITTGAGLMLLYNWLFILTSGHKLNSPNAFGKIKYVLGMTLVLAGISGTLISSSNRPGFFISIGFVCLIVIVTFIMSKKWKKQEAKKG